MITLEGMAMAKPIITTRIEGITEQITDGETGVLVHYRDSNDLAHAMVKLLDNRQLADNLCLNARRMAEQDFSVEKMVEETEKIYESLFVSSVYKE